MMGYSLGQSRTGIIKTSYVDEAKYKISTAI
jgi:hypothetical protein